MKVLLLNPWIYDFAAYDLWLKPFGLLRVGALLREWGWEEEEISFRLACRNRSLAEIKELPPRSAIQWFDRTVRSAAERPLRALDFLRANLP